jgi:class 3 adenylate cyclase/sugar phosphate isomerase/epimerase
MASTQDLKKAALELNMLDIDTLTSVANEAAALGRHDEAVTALNQVLASLEERYRSDAGTIPVDIVVRRFRVLLYLAHSYAAVNHLKQAIQHAIEANALAHSHLTEFPELFIQSCVELGDYYMRSGDTAEARRIIELAAAAPRGEDSAFDQAIVSLGAGRLLLHIGKAGLSIRSMATGLVALKNPQNAEQTLLRAELLATVGMAHKKSDNAPAAEEAFRSAAALLFDEASKSAAESRTIDAVILFAKLHELFKEMQRSVENTVRWIETALKLASLMDLRSRWDEANRFYIEIMEVYKNTGVIYPRGLVLARVGVGNYQMHLKQYDRAETILQSAVKEAEQAGEIYALCHSYYILGLTYSKRGNDDKGIALFEETIDRLKELPKGEAAEAAHLAALANNQLGFIEAKRRRYDAAADRFHQSIDILKDMPADVALGEAYRFLGDVHTEMDRNAQGERALKKSLAIFEKASATFEIARTYKSLGINFLNSSDLDKAAFFLDESIKSLERLDIEAELPMAYSSRAKVCVMKEEYQEAEALFTKDFNIAKKTDNKHSLAFSYYHLGRVRRFLNHSHSAEDWLQRSLALFNEVNNQDMAAKVMLELAFCVAARKDIKGASDLCAKVQAVFEKRRNSPELAQLLLTRGIILRDAKRMQMAQRCFEDSIRIHDKLNRPTLETAETRYEFAKFWRDQGKRKEAVEQLTVAISIAEKLGLSKKANHCIALLNELDPKASAKMQLSRFMDKDSVEQMSKTSTSEQLTVDRKNLSVLFTDIRDFTSISESVVQADSDWKEDDHETDLKVLTSLLNDFYSTVIQVVSNHGGLVNKFIGDAALCIFNMDGKMVNHPAAAVRAATDLVRTINEINMIRKMRSEMSINIGVGVNTGTVLVGNFGSSTRHDFTAIGDTVNTASRMQSIAKAGEIIISQGVYEAVGGLVDAEDLGEEALKGKGQSIRLWKIIGVKE